MSSMFVLMCSLGQKRTKGNMGWGWHLWKENSYGFSPRGILTVDFRSFRKVNPGANPNPWEDMLHVIPGPTSRFNARIRVSAYLTSPQVTTEPIPFLGLL